MGPANPGRSAATALATTGSSPRAAGGRELVDAIADALADDAAAPAEEGRP